MYELTGEVPNGNHVLFYAGEFGYFMSNFSAFEVWWQGQTWKTSEHAYQAAKFNPNGSTYHLISDASSAHGAFELAQIHADEVNPSWSEVKVSMMEEIVRAKHSQHEEIQKWLQETGDAWLIENAPKDSFWGRGPDWKGRNELGKIWMQIREEARM